MIGRFDKRRRHKTFEDRVIVLAVVNLWFYTMGLSSAQAARLLQVSRSTVSRWRSGKVRPDTSALRKMCTLALWQLESWPAAAFAAVYWDDMDVEYVEGRERKSWPNPFYLSLPHRQNPRGYKYPFGSLRGCSKIMRDLQEHCGVMSWPHLVALLGMSKRSNAGYDHVKHWTRGEWAIGPQYLVRILALILWASDPNAEDLGDMWAVSWEAWYVEFTHQRRAMLGPYASPSNPFFRMGRFARPHRPGSRLRPQMRVRFPPMAVEIAPVRAYDPKKYIPAADRRQAEEADQARREAEARRRQVEEARQAREEADQAREEARQAREAEAKMRRETATDRRAKAEQSLPERVQTEEFVRQKVETYRVRGWVLQDDVREAAIRLGILPKGHSGNWAY